MGCGNEMRGSVHPYIRTSLEGALGGFLLGNSDYPRKGDRVA